MAKILVADEISEEGIEILKKALDVTYTPDISAEKLCETIGNYDALLVRSRTKVTKEVIDSGKRLKVVGRAGVGVDNIDLNHATEAGILVVNSPEGNTASAAEHTLALMLSLARMLPTADASMKSGKWERNRFVGCELFNKTIGIIGLGKIGSRVAKSAQALGMRVIVYDPFLSSERASQLNMTSVELNELFSKADFITIHTPKTRETTNLINKDTLASMKRGVRIINASRGGIIDEEALAQAIKSGHVAGAALDVFDKEPPVDSPLIGLDSKILLTPHLGASTHEAQFNVAIDLAEQIKDYLTGGMVRSPVNLPSMRPDVLKSLGKYVWLSETMGAIVGELSEGTITEIEVISSGGLAEKDTAPLAVSGLCGILSRRIEGVTHVNTQIIAKNHGISVRESKVEESEHFHEELSLVIKTNKDTYSISGTVLAHDEPIVTKINQYPIHLTPARYMLFTEHRDQPGMVAKVAGILGTFNINISTMGVGRRTVREDAVMVMTLDDPLKTDLLNELSTLPGIHQARYVSLNGII